MSDSQKMLGYLHEHNRSNAAARSGILVFLLLLFHLFIPSRLFADSLVRVTKEETTNEAQLFIVNEGIVDATVCFKVDLDNAGLDHKDDVFVIGPGEQIRAFKITRNKIDKPWRYQYQYRWRWGSPGARHDKSVVYKLPFEKGRTVFVGQGFNGNFSHGGEQKYAIDWPVPVGTPVHAARGGLVVATESRYSRGGASANFLQAVNYVVVRHEDGTFGNYFHFEKDGVVVRAGQTVSTGELIGYSGNTGFSTEPHLHFHVYEPTDEWEAEPVKIRFSTQEGNRIILKQGKTYTAN